ncbi:uncharacterized protein LOC131951170 [Physella acuta]|uniref:uncharacterized protein LOC131951170 n=1 Tax=Physella acuta TaxID=109671 RepID=UPI0027DCB479|nr:uncharacterized protein LOC131951170 [Physella acuta]
MLRRWRSPKKILYAAAILLVTIVLYAMTSSDEYVDEVNPEWVLPLVAHNNYRVNPVLQEPLQRLPLGPFEDVPVLVDGEPPSNNAAGAPGGGDSAAAPKPAAPALGSPGAAPSMGAGAPALGAAAPALGAGAPVLGAGAPAVEAGVPAAGAPVAGAPAVGNGAPVLGAGAPPVGVGQGAPAPVVAGAPAAVFQNALFPPAPVPQFQIVPDAAVLGSNPAAAPVVPAPQAPAASGPLAQPVPAAFVPLAQPVPAAFVPQAQPAVPAVGAAVPGALPQAGAAPAPQLQPGQPAPAAPAVAPAPVPIQPAAAPAQNPGPPAPQPAAKPLPDFAKITTEMSRRLAYTRGECEKFKVPNNVETEVYVLPQLNISYCKIPKAGCTYWEQVFSYLNKNPSELTYLGISSPFQISKFDIRYTSHFNLPRRDFKTPEHQQEIVKTTRVLFVRHPLERLWSCYLEKFYLIDFWTTAGITMKTAGAENKCPKSITFREFIEFTLPLLNEHWSPITELCNPCVYQPHVIGHVETLRDDTYYTLKQMQLDWIFSEQERLSREENQMLDMVIYNYQIHSIHWYSFYHRCLSQRELASRLWDVFKKVGYLSSHAALPDNLPDYNQTTIIRELKSQFRKFPLSPSNGRAQQLKMIRRDFDALPKPILAKVLERYAMDFQLFGYNTSLPAS